MLQRKKGTDSRSNQYTQTTFTQVLPVPFLYVFPNRQC